MSGGSIISILHLSDFHYSDRKAREQQIVIDALLLDLKEICVGYRRPDLIVFSGDFVQAGGRDSHLDAYDHFLDKVSKTTSCSDDRIFIAPGNHDLSRDYVKEARTAQGEVRDLIDTPDEIDWLNTKFANGELSDMMELKFKAFREFEELFSSPGTTRTRIINNSFAVVDRFDSLSIDIVGMNTAAFSSGGLESLGSDQGKLSFPEYVALDAFNATASDYLKIVVTHHPLAYLSEMSGRMLERLISENADLHLFGHMHDPQPKLTVGLSGTLLSSQAGAIFTARRDAYIGYSLILINPATRHVEIMLRSYFNDRRQFDAAIDLAKDGRWWSSPESKAFFKDQAEPINEAEFRAHLAGPALEKLREREEHAGGDGQTHKQFVAPPLLLTTIQDKPGEDGRTEVEQLIEFGEVLESEANLIIYARQEYGKTTVLRESRYDFLKHAKARKTPRLPALIDFSEIRSNKASLLRKLKGSSEHIPDDIRFETLLSNGNVAVLIDDVIFSDGNRMKILRDFVIEYPKNRFIFTAPYNSAIQFGATVDPEMPVRFEFVELQELRRKELRALLEKDERCVDVERWLDRLQSEFVEINLPFTAANGTIIIEILSEKYHFQPINRSVLMEQFIDSTLSKGAIDQSHRETFDYTNKTDLLSYVAERMARSNVYVIEKEKLRSFAKQYIDERGLPVDVDDILDDFLEVRIFVKKSETTFAFRYKGVLEYFIALRMISDDSFRNWVLEEERYLSFVNEIGFYAGKLRNDLDLLEKVAERHQVLMNVLTEELGEINLSKFNTFEIPTDSDDIAEVENLLSDLLEKPLTREERDEELQAEIPKDAEDRQEVFRPSAREINEKLWLSLALYSGLVKNLELIDDASKRRHLKEIWRGWASLLLMALSFAPTLATQRKIRINGVLYEFHAPHGMSDTTLLRHIVLKLPHVHLRFLSGALGTEKLMRQLCEPTLDDANDPMIFEFFRTGLITDLRLPGMVDAVSGFLKKLTGFPYLTRSFLEHLFETRRLDRLTDDEIVRLEKPMAKAIADLGGGSRRDRAAATTKQLQRFERRRLLMKARGNR